MADFGRIHRWMTASTCAELADAVREIDALIQSGADAGVAIPPGLDALRLDVWARYEDACQFVLTMRGTPEHGHVL